MRRAAATVVVLVGADPGPALATLDRAANVSVVEPDADGSPLERAVAAWQVASTVHAPYAAHASDPLEAVADAWVRLYDESGAVGEVEVAVRETRLRHRAGSIELPDYYLVLDAELLPTTRRHWYLGVLHRHAPARVLPVDADPVAVLSSLTSLAAGRWWPELDRMLDGVERVAPDVDYSSSQDDRSRSISF